MESPRSPSASGRTPEHEVGDEMLSGGEVVRGEGAEKCRGEVKVVCEQVRLDAVEDVRRDGVAEVVGDVDGEGAHFRVEELDLVVVEGRGSVLFAIWNAPDEDGRRQHIQKVRAGDVDEHVAPPSVPEALEVLGRKSVPVDGRSRNGSVRSSEKMHRNRGWVCIGGV